MNIFDTYRDAVRFAFSLASRPGEIGGASRNSMVRIALNDAGVDAPGARVPGLRLDGAALALLDEFAGKVQVAIENLPSAMRAALVAHYSLDWEVKRSATTWLQNHFRPQMNHVIDHPELADRMVSRHYIAQRERGPGWTLEAISVEFRVSVARLQSAVRMIELIDGALIDDAITLLAHSLPLPEVADA